MKSAISTVCLPSLISVKEIKKRLELIFPATFPDRQILVGDMASKVIFVFLYGGFIEGNNQYLRPSFIYFFTQEQAKKTSDCARIKWFENVAKPGFRVEGTRWYADNTREPIRDDLIKNELIRLGIVTKLSGYAVTSPKPTMSLVLSFSELFSQALKKDPLADAIDAWRIQNLSPSVLQRMALKAKGVFAKGEDVYIMMPDKTQIRISAGPSSIIIKDLIESYTKIHMTEPVVLWISESDQKEHSNLKERAKEVGLNFDLNTELPDLILADFGEPLQYIFCEVVASDGAVTEARKQILLEFVASSQIEEDSVRFLTAFEDREAQAFRKNFSKLAVNSLVWFRTEPSLLLILKDRELTNTKK